MNQILLLAALAVLLLVVAGQLIRTLRSDGYGLRPPPRSRHEEVWASHAGRRVV